MSAYSETGGRPSSWDAAVRSILGKAEYAQLVRDCYYDQPVAAAARRFAESAEWSATRALLPASGNALDIGAGQGVASYALAQSGFQVTAVEPDDSDIVGCGAIRQLGLLCERPITIVRSTAEKLPFATGEFDVVYCRQALHHAADIDQFCAEAARVLKRGGTFLAAREHVLSRGRDLRRFLELHPLHKLYGGESAYTLRRYETAMRKSGMSVKQVLLSFDSPINYAPRTQAQVTEELAQRANRLPGLGNLIRRVAATRPGRNWLLRMASLADRRPGRLTTFVCVK